ncbi:hypothetical protein [Alkalimonas amylolytica]|uniref:Uncharacterized protein n=1 Tax=Alkalimonas amylolytica TaxID=152573 RepID=A0A1H4G3F9_ALKAM|nr:hypothetical protein [Alkalimonas amylolytica]SEB04143.1 hypothetical protein SAMN04488051_1186 [Alkalimonas amylolytica]
MECPDLNSLVLSERDFEVINEIRRIHQNGRLLERALPAGVMATIFVGSNSMQASYNITTTDWEMFAQAMAALPNIVRTRVYQQANLRRLERGITPQQSLFWRAVADGCRGL